MSYEKKAAAQIVLLMAGAAMLCFGPTNIIRSIFVNEMFLNAGNRVKNKRIELVSKPVK